MPEQLPFTALLNKLFGAAVNKLLNVLHVHPEYPQAPITNPVAMQLLVVLLLGLVFVLIRSRLSVDRPGGLQHIAEGVNGFFSNLGQELIGHEYRQFVPYISALGMYILANNLIGLVPAFESPTATPAVPLGCAITTFVYYHYSGIKANGAGYINQFLAPVIGPSFFEIVGRILLSLLMVPIELVSHLARVLSLTVRLFANMYAGEMVTLAFFSMAPLLIPVVFMGLHIGVALIQTYIFVLLTCVYLGGAIAHEH